MAIVAAGYDRIAQRYLAWSGPSVVRREQLDRLLALLSRGSRVLELGCGAGEPVTRELSELHPVTAVDVSSTQLALAASGAPKATLIQADMSTLDLPEQTFDAVVAFYSMTHVPRDRHAGLLARIAGWLRPGGLFFATMGASDNPDDYGDDWLGAPMFWSHFDADTNRALVQAAGLDLVEATVIDEDEDGVAVPFLWVVARARERSSGRAPGPCPRGHR
ncbi:MAG: trans-aconitate 2-methyltransferase [Candidatus Limnocylindria bacterium]